MTFGVVIKTAPLCKLEAMSSGPYGLIEIGLMSRVVLMMMSGDYCDCQDVSHRNRQRPSLS